jgi:hypothetical protein
VIRFSPRHAVCPGEPASGGRDAAAFSVRKKGAGCGSQAGEVVRLRTDSGASVRGQQVGWENPFVQVIAARTPSDAADGQETLRVPGLLRRRMRTSGSLFIDNRLSSI